MKLICSLAVSYLLYSFITSEPLTNTLGARSLERRARCTAYVLISARGTGELQTGPVAVAGFAKGVLGQVPNGIKYEVVYPASMDYLNGPLVGAKDAQRYLEKQMTACPKQVYVFFGYSEGAMVITQLVLRMKIPPNRFVATVFYGNPYKVSGAPQNKCGGSTGGGVATGMGAKMPASLAEKTYDCCKAGDGICQKGGTMIPHVAYPNSANEKAAIAFVVPKLKAAISKGSGGDGGGGENVNKGTNGSPQTPSQTPKDAEAEKKKKNPFVP